MKEYEREFFYEYYDRNAAPKVTVCLLLDENGNTARGLSICDKNDIFNKEVGELEAKKVAERAIKNRPIDDIRRWEARSMLIETQCPWNYRAERNPDLSWWERKMLFGRRKMHNYDFIDQEFGVFDDDVCSCTDCTCED